jgi:hypothetical protein
LPIFLTFAFCFSFKFEGSELLDKLIGDDTYEKYPDKGRMFALLHVFVDKLQKI